uniref:Uncharacterized protein n=1 Tax=Oryza barthii TaxID=65489 RepID=A0A0D3FG62_9ORYZ
MVLCSCPAMVTVSLSHGRMADGQSPSLSILAIAVRLTETKARNDQGPVVDHVVHRTTWRTIRKTSEHKASMIFSIKFAAPIAFWSFSSKLFIRSERRPQQASVNISIQYEISRKPTKMIVGNNLAKRT